MKLKETRKTLLASYDSNIVDSLESTRIVSLVVDLDTGSRFGRDLKYLAKLGFGVGRNVVNSIRFGRIVTNRPPCCRFVIPEVDLRIYVAQLGF